MSEYLRVQGTVLQDIELENQHGSVKRCLLVVAAELFPGAHQANATELRLVFDTTQLHRLRALLEHLPPIEDSTQVPPPSVQ